VSQQEIDGAIVGVLALSRDELRHDLVKRRVGGRTGLPARCQLVVVFTAAEDAGATEQPVAPQFAQCFEYSPSLSASSRSSQHRPPFLVGSLRYCSISSGRGDTANDV